MKNDLTILHDKQEPVLQNNHGTLKTKLVNDPKTIRKHIQDLKEMVSAPETTAGDQEIFRAEIEKYEQKLKDYELNFDKDEP